MRQTIYLKSGVKLYSDKDFRDASLVDWIQPCYYSTLHRYDPSSKCWLICDQFIYDEYYMRRLSADDIAEILPVINKLTILLLNGKNVVVTLRANIDTKCDEYVIAIEDLELKSVTESVVKRLIASDYLSIAKTIKSFLINPEAYKELSNQNGHI